VNYQDNKQRGSGALSWLLFTSSGVTTENTIKGAKYVNSKPVYFPKIDTRFDNDNRGGSAYRTLAIHDLDGTTTGIANSYVLLHDGDNDSVATDDSCKIQPTWNASICSGDVGRVNMGGGGGGFGGLGGARGGARAGGAGPGAGGALAGLGAPGAGAAPRAGGAGPGGAAAPGGAAGPAGAAPRGAGAGGLAALGGARGAGPGGAAAPQQPITFSRNGKDFKITGNGSTLRAGTDITVKTERPEVSFSLSEMDKGSWVVFQLPGFSKATTGTQLDSMEALRKATETSYYKDNNSLWVKLVVPNPPAMPISPLERQAAVTVTR
jgi:cell migration-inducing and hyaluronan-binding protein